jgi:hypothetical protein
MYQQVTKRTSYAPPFENRIAEPELPAAALAAMMWSWLQSVIERFARGRVLWAVWLATEQAMGRLPMVLLTPVVAAFVGTATAVSNPPKQEVHHGVVVESPRLGMCSGLRSRAAPEA